MTVQEAIETVKHLNIFKSPNWEELMVVRNIVRTALEKQVPQKPRKTRCALMCARCGHKITESGCAKRGRMYCKKCGQAIDWEEDNGNG